MVMIEAVYVVIITIVIIFFIMNVGIVYYNRLVLTSIANEAATSVANIYGAPDKDPFYAFMEPDDFKKINPYRYLLFGSMYNKNSRYNQTIMKKSKAYAAYLIYESEFSAEHSKQFSSEDSYVMADVTVNSDNMLGLQMLTVTVKRTYSVFDLNPVAFFGLNPKYEASASGTAVCYDIVHQMNSVALLDEIETRIGKEMVIDSIGNVLGIIEKVQKIWTKLGS